MMCNFVYLLRCARDTLYCGWTNDLVRRLAAHNAGTGGKYTRIGEMNACPGFMFPDSFMVLTDPSGFRLDNRDTPEQEEIYAVGENGMPVMK